MVNFIEPTPYNTKHSIRHVYAEFTSEENTLIRKDDTILVSS